MDITRELVDQIVELVLQRMGSFPYQDASHCRAPKQILAVFCGGMTGAEEAGRALRRLTECGHKVKALFTPCAGQVNGAAWLKERAPAVQVLLDGYAVSPEEFAEEADLVMLPVLTCNSLAKLAQGIADNQALSAVLFALLDGKPVVAAEDACTGKKDTPLAARLREQRLCLETYGVRFSPASLLAEKAEQRLSEQENRGAVQRFKGKLLTLSHLRSFQPGVLSLTPGAIVTLAARDEAKERGIELRTDT